MKKVIKSTAFAVMISAFVFTSCENEDKLPEVSNLSVDNIINMNNLGNRTLVTDENLLNSLKTLDIDVGVVSKGDFHLPDGTVEERIYIGSDITFTQKDIDELIQSVDQNRQYRTFNLVTGSNQTIDILGYTGGS